MAQDGLQLQELFTRLPLCKEDKAVLLRAVRKAEPTFLPPQPPLPSFEVNTSPLLKEIYSTVSFSLQVLSRAGCTTVILSLWGHREPQPSLYFSSLSRPHLWDFLPAPQRLNQLRVGKLLVPSRAITQG